MIEGRGHFCVSCKQCNNIAIMIYIKPLEACHLKMIQSKGQSHFIWLRSSENFIQRGWLGVLHLLQRKSYSSLVDYSVIPMAQLKLTITTSEYLNVNILTVSLYGYFVSFLLVWFGFFESL